MAFCMLKRPSAEDCCCCEISFAFNSHEHQSPMCLSLCWSFYVLTASVPEVHKTCNVQDVMGMGLVSMALAS